MTDATMMPNKLSALVRFAVMNAREMDRDRFAPKSGVGLGQGEGGAVEFSLSGAFMAGYLGYDPDIEVDWECLPSDHIEAHCALSDFERGDFARAAVYSRDGANGRFFQMNGRSAAFYLHATPDQAAFVDGFAVESERSQWGYVDWASFDAFLDRAEAFADGAEAAAL